LADDGNFNGLILKTARSSSKPTCTWELLHWFHWVSKKIIWRQKPYCSCYDFANVKGGRSELTNAPNRPNAMLGICFLVTELSILAAPPNNWGGW